MIMIITDPTVVLQCEYNVHNLPSKPQRRKKGESACAPPECRITSLSSLLLIDINDTYARDLSCLVAGCSDSIIRYMRREGEGVGLYCVF